MIGNEEINVGLNITPRLIKDFRSSCKPIKRTRKQQIAKAKHMIDWHNHTSYEWSQWWKNRQESQRGES